MYSKYIMKRKRKVDNGPVSESDEDPGDASLDIKARASLWNLTTPVIFSLCIWCCPNWILLLSIILYVKSSKKQYDKNLIVTFHHRMKKIIGNFNFGSSISLSQILQFDFDSFKLFNCDKAASDFLSEYYRIVDLLKSNCQLKQMLEELYWFFNKQIDNITEFRKFTLGYLRPDVIATHIVLAGNILTCDIHHVNGEVQISNLGLNIEKLVELDLKHGLFHHLVNEYITNDPASASKLIIDKCLTNENILRALLLKLKILNCKFTFDNDGNPLSAEQDNEVEITDGLYNCDNVNEVYTIIKMNVYLLMIATVGDEFSLPRRWHVFYWTEKDRKTIYGSKSSSSKYDYRSIPKYNDEDYDSFNETLSIYAEIGDIVPRTYRIEVNGIDITIGQWLYRLHDAFMENNLSAIKITKLREIPSIRHLFQDPSRSIPDCQWYTTYDVVKSLKRVKILKSDVVTIDGANYPVGQWIANNLKAYRNNKMNPVRLNLLREIPFIGRRFF